jgi:uncharacterized membrane protein
LHAAVALDMSRLAPARTADGQPKAGGTRTKEGRMKTSNGMLIASAAASLILAGAVLARAEQKAGGDQVMCAGINTCKGQGACAGAGNSCAGKNACKGKGMVETSKDECLKQGGKVAEAKKEK